MSTSFLQVRTKLGMDDILPFGKHQGHTVEVIVKDRPEYIAWLIENTSLKFYPSVHEAVCKYGLPKVNYNQKRYNYKYYGTTMVDYDHDTLGDWFDDVPF